MEPSGHTAAFLSVVISDVGCAKSEKAVGVLLIHYLFIYLFIYLF
jgi:hypothetical protein